MIGADDGWAWFDRAGPPAADPDIGPDAGGGIDADLARAFARCLRGGDGERVLRHLSALTRDRALGPGAPDALLRHVEGQRHLVAYITALVERGRGLPPRRTAGAGASFPTDNGDDT